MKVLDRETDEGVQKTLNGTDPSDVDLSDAGRRKALKLIITSAPVIITFTAGVPRADAAGYAYLDTSGSTSSHSEEESEYFEQESDTTSPWDRGRGQGPRF